MGDTGAAASFTPKQGQYLAFIYGYTKLNRVAPAEADFVRYFEVSAPSVHQMIKKLPRRGGSAERRARAAPSACACPASNCPTLSR